MYFSIIHCDANCLNLAVSAGLCFTYVYMVYCLVICCRGPQGRIVILANCDTLYKLINKSINKSINQSINK